MGREVKRVPLDFNWPIGEEWYGYINPYSSVACPVCEGDGYNQETSQISKSWHAFDDVRKRWSDNLTQDEVDALVASGRLKDLTHRFVSGQGWVPNDPPTHPTAAQVNAWSRTGIGHDSINMCICVEARARRLGVWGECPLCNGKGAIWFSPEIEAAAFAWRGIDPPPGDGWQLWETVSDGSPMSPVFATREELVDWMVSDGTRREAAEAFTLQGWAPSMVVIGGRLTSGVDAADAIREDAP